MNRITKIEENYFLYYILKSAASEFFKKTQERKKNLKTK